MSLSKDFTIFRKESEIDPSKYYIVTYDLKSKSTLADAAWNLAIGQSVGNPKLRNRWENDELFENHSCLVLYEDEDARNRMNYGREGEVRIAFPISNTDWKDDGISQLLCQLMGGQVDIDQIEMCHLLDFELHKEITRHFHAPKYGISGMRKLVGATDRPFFGAIVKPKTGITASTLLDMVKEMVEGGVDFIKEDEILANPSFNPLKERIPLIANYLANCGRKIVYCFCINADPHAILDRARLVADQGVEGLGIHVNVWSGLGSYNSIRKLDLPLFIHFQKSGDKTFTDLSGKFGIAWSVIVKLAALQGVDTIHTGMFGGYLSDTEDSLRANIKVLNNNNVVPALSCGMHPGLIDDITQRFGIDYMANVGGAVHGHPGGTLAGAKAMAAAVRGTVNREYKDAIKTWGYVTPYKGRN